MGSVDGVERFLRLFSSSFLMVSSILVYSTGSGSMFGVVLHASRYECNLFAISR